MGATSFSTIQIAKTAKEAFEMARESARAYNGHQEGYSGDIQRKRTFVMVTDKTLTRKSAQQVINKIYDNDGHGLKDPFNINDKWDGPAGCIRLRTTEVRSTVKRNHFVWLFFGISPS